MSNIRSLIEGYMNGNAWEDLCVKCYRIRYQNENYTYIPAAQGGDAGIRGLPKTELFISVIAQSASILMMNFMPIKEIN